MTGGIVGLAFPLWISFGAYDLVLAPARDLTFNISQCANLTLSNITEIELPTKDDMLVALYVYHLKNICVECCWDLPSFDINMHFTHKSSPPITSFCP